MQGKEAVMARVHSFAAAAACALSLVATTSSQACAATVAPQAMPLPTLPAIAPAAPAAVPTTTHRADVDGDGRRDTVTVGQASKQRLRVHVRTARGTSSTLYIPQGDFASWAPQEAYQGAASFDGVRGQEVFILYGLGAHTPWFKVVTWRDGRLYASRNPATGDMDWTPDAAFGYGVGYTISGSTANRRLAMTSATRSGNGYAGSQTHFAWVKNRWVKKSSNRVRFSDRASMDYFGWHVPGIAIWPDL